jgi:hypothetical protein
MFNIVAHRIGPHRTCFYTFDQKNRIACVVQRIEDAHQRALIYQQARQDRHRISFRIASMLDRHATVISGQMLIQGALDADLVHRRFKTVAAVAVSFHCMFLLSLRTNPNRSRRRESF